MLALTLLFLLLLSTESLMSLSLILLRLLLSDTINETLCFAVIVLLSALFLLYLRQAYASLELFLSIICLLTYSLFSKFFSIYALR